MWPALGRNGSLQHSVLLLHYPASNSNGATPAHQRKRHNVCRCARQAARIDSLGQASQAAGLLVNHAVNQHHSGGGSRLEWPCSSGCRCGASGSAGWCHEGLLQQRADVCEAVLLVASGGHALGGQGRQAAGVQVGQPADGRWGGRHGWESVSGAGRAAGNALAGAFPTSQTAQDHLRLRQAGGIGCNSLKRALNPLVLCRHGGCRRCRRRRPRPSCATQLPPLLRHRLGGRCRCHGAHGGACRGPAEEGLLDTMSLRRPEPAYG